MLLNFKFKTFSINLNAQHVNGMTHLDLAVHSRKCTCAVIRYSVGLESASPLLLF